jgi:site-specific recombinase XerC
LAAEGKSGKTVRMYTEAVQWFAAAHLLRETGRTGWDEVDVQDIQRWMVWLLGRYSDSYASNQYRALQQFFRWWSAEEELPDPMARLRPPKVGEKLVPVFTSGELRELERACQGRTFAQRRDYAIIAVFRATGIRLSELAGIRYDAGDPLRSDIDLWQREIRVRGKGGRARIVRIGHEAARDLAQRPPRGRHRRHQPEQLALVADHPEVADRLAAVGDRAGEVGQHPAPVMDQQPRRRQRLRQARGQADVVGQRPDQRHPGMRHDPGTAAGNFQTLQPAGSVHLTGASRSGPDKGFNTPILPGQEHFS